MIDGNGIVFFFFLNRREETEIVEESELVKERKKMMIKEMGLHFCYLSKIGEREIGKTFHRRRKYG